MNEGWLKILKPVTLEITIFREKNQNFEWKTTLNFASRSGLSHIFPRMAPFYFVFQKP